MGDDPENANKYIAFFSTDGGRFPPRSAHAQDTSLVVRSNPKRDADKLIRTLRSKWPHVCLGIFAPWKVYWFFDEFDFCVQGGRYLYEEVLMRIQKENEDMLTQFCKEWSDFNSASFHAVKAVPVTGLFHQQDHERYGDGFLQKAKEWMCHAFDRALLLERRASTHINSEPISKSKVVNLSSQTSSPSTSLDTFERLKSAARREQHLDTSSHRVRAAAAVPQPAYGRVGMTVESLPFIPHQHNIQAVNVVSEGNVAPVNFVNGVTQFVMHPPTGQPNLPFPGLPTLQPVPALLQNDQPGMHGNTALLVNHLDLTPGASTPGRQLFVSHAALQQAAQLGDAYGAPNNTPMPLQSPHNEPQRFSSEHRGSFGKARGRAFKRSSFSRQSSTGKDNRYEDVSSLTPPNVPRENRLRRGSWRQGAQNCQSSGASQLAASREQPNAVSVSAPAVQASQDGASEAVVQATMNLSTSPITISHCPHSGDEASSVMSQAVAGGASTSSIPQSMRVSRESIGAGVTDITSAYIKVQQSVSEGVVHQILEKIARVRCVKSKVSSAGVPSFWADFESTDDVRKAISWGVGRKHIKPEVPMSRWTERPGNHNSPAVSPTTYRNNYSRDIHPSFRTRDSRIASKSQEATEYFNDTTSIRNKNFSPQDVRSSLDLGGDRSHSAQPKQTTWASVASGAKSADAGVTSLSNIDEHPNELIDVQEDSAIPPAANDIHEPHEDCGNNLKDERNTLMSSADSSRNQPTRNKSAEAGRYEREASGNITRVGLEPLDTAISTLHVTADVKDGRTQELQREHLDPVTRSVPVENHESREHAHPVAGAEATVSGKRKGKVKKKKDSQRACSSTMEQCIHPDKQSGQREERDKGLKEASTYIISEGESTIRPDEHSKPPNDAIVDNTSIKGGTSLPRKSAVQGRGLVPLAENHEEPTGSVAGGSLGAGPSESVDRVTRSLEVRSKDKAQEESSETDVAGLRCSSTDTTSTSAKPRRRSSGGVNPAAPELRAWLTEHEEILELLRKLEGVDESKRSVWRQSADEYGRALKTAEGLVKDIDAKLDGSTKNTLKTKLRKRRKTAVESHQKQYDELIMLLNTVRNRFEAQKLEVKSAPVRYSYTQNVLPVSSTHAAYYSNESGDPPQMINISSGALSLPGARLLPAGLDERKMNSLLTNADLVAGNFGVEKLETSKRRKGKGKQVRETGQVDGAEPDSSDNENTSVINQILRVHNTNVDVEQETRSDPAQDAVFIVYPNTQSESDKQGAQSGLAKAEEGSSLSPIGNNSISITDVANKSATEHSSNTAADCSDREVEHKRDSSVISNVDSDSTLKSEDTLKDNGGPVSAPIGLGITHERDASSQLPTGAISGVQISEPLLSDPEAQKVEASLSIGGGAEPSNTGQNLSGKEPLPTENQRPPSGRFDDVRVVMPKQMSWAKVAAKSSTDCQTPPNTSLVPPAAYGKKRPGGPPGPLTAGVGRGNERNRSVDVSSSDGGRSRSAQRDAYQDDWSVPKGDEWATKGFPGKKRA
ncbi:MAG: hypothetical protein Q9162_004022 [Coniocarpon cinnabarinum]